MVRRTPCFLLALLALLMSSCLRYVPSRRELAASQKSGPAHIGGPELFREHQTKLAHRLTKLLADRKASEVPTSGRSYRLGAGDVLQVTVFGLDDLNTTGEVDGDGFFTLPLVGRVDAAGRSLFEFQQALVSELRPFVRNPKISVEVKEYHAHQVSVIGAVGKPGVYPLTREGQTLTEVLSLAGGRTDKAGTRIILIPAPAEGEGAASVQEGKVERSAHGVELDLQDLTGTVDKRPLLLALRGGDTVIVPEMGTVKVDGEVNRAGSFPLSANISTLGAVAAAGGLTYSANVHEVEVIRDLGNGRKASVTVDLEQVALNGAPDVPLRDGDIVRVPSESGKFRTRQIVEALNGFFRGGISGSVRYQ